MALSDYIVPFWSIARELGRLNHNIERIMRERLNLRDEPSSTEAASAVTEKNKITFPTDEEMAVREHLSMSGRNEFESNDEPFGG
jgi:hypothetical protein